MMHCKKTYNCYVQSMLKINTRVALNFAAFALFFAAFCVVFLVVFFWSCFFLVVRVVFLVVRVVFLGSALCFWAPWCQNMLKCVKDHSEHHQIMFKIMHL